MLHPGPTVAAKPGEMLERSLLAAGGAVLATLVAVCGIVLVMRRLGGGFEPSGAVLFLVVAALGGSAVVACDAAAGAAGLAAGWRGVSRLGYLAALAAVTWPPRFATAIDAVLFIAGVGIAGAVVVRPVARADVGRWLGRIRPQGSRLPAPPPAAGPLPPAAQTAPPCPGRLLQRFERYEFEGVDHVRATLSLVVAQGSRSAHGHVGFCPAFREVPRVETSTAYDGVEAVVTAPEIVPWGVRIECRLDEPAEESLEIPVDLLAQAPA